MKKQPQQPEPLKPCPICGSEPILENDETDGCARVKCPSCWARTYYEDTARQAIAEWNRRAEA